jgi:hypothetical protein
MHHQPWRLIDDDEGLIFVNNIEGDGFGDVSSFIGRRDGIDLNLLSSPDSMFGGRVSIFDRYLLTQYPRLQSASGLVWQQSGQRLVKPHPCVIRGDGKFEGRSSRFRHRKVWRYNDALLLLFHKNSYAT